MPLKLMLFISVLSGIFVGIFSDNVMILRFNAIFYCILWFVVLFIDIKSGD